MSKNTNIDSIDHLATHSEMAVMDQAAVDKLKALLSNGGKIMESFNHGDKWPNQDGYFEFVPSFTRKPIQNFFVQIKGTSNYEELDEGVKYKLTSLGFPSYIKNEISLDPGILFVVLNPTEQDEERFFWKYMSNRFVDSINFAKTSFDIIFTESDELKKDNINSFCDELLRISETHSFVKTMDKREYNLETAERLLVYKNKKIEESLDSCNIVSDDDREEISLSMLQFIKEFCFGALLINALKTGKESSTIRFAWETAVINKETRFLADFFRYLEYIGNRIPDYGQSERLMLKYYHFLWKVRELLAKYNIHVLSNLEKFPLKIDQVDKEYYENVAESIELVYLQNSGKHNVLNKDAALYYIKKKNVFFVNNKCYYELTLQSSNSYADKQNRITVYSKENIETKYSIQIGYWNSKINLWDRDYSIKVISGWRVRIAPRCLNRYARIIGLNMKISSNYNEYNDLMNYLTEKGANLLELLDLEEINLESIFNNIFKSDKTEELRKLLRTVKDVYNKDNGPLGKYVIRFLLHDLREDSIDRVLPPPTNLGFRLKDTPAYVTRGCFSFENNPVLYNLKSSKTENLISLLSEVTGIEFFKNYLPYIYLKNYMKSTGEIYSEANNIVSLESVKAYNSIITDYDKSKGFEIIEDDGYFCIKSYRDGTVKILNKLSRLAETAPDENKGEKTKRENIIKHLDIDEQKQDILKRALRKSKLLLIYGAAGTGKTTIIKHISEIFSGKKRLYLTYTKAALSNLKSKLKMNNDANAEFLTLKKLHSEMSEDIDIVFIDECSVIDNLEMLDFLENKLSSKSMLVLVGDIHQIESIDFGNWFYYAKYSIDSDRINYELSKNWRTEEQNLRDLWSEVRNHGDKLTEILAVDGPFTQDIGSDIMIKQDEEEVILCLNYDGKFGLNNINAYMQNASSEVMTYNWKEWSYKKGDPILFIESKRFPELYNNLKGKIVDITIDNNVGISFVIDVEDELPESNQYNIVDRNKNITRIQFVIYNCDELNCEEADEQMKSIVPFQLAYAVSIHKSQGLEYNSVKIVIPAVNSEKITYDIFYTAITRAKKKLKIYCSSETMTDIVDKIKEHSKSTNSLKVLKKYLNKVQSVPPIPVINQDEYYVANRDEPIGPFTVSKLREMVTEGEVVSSTLLWKKGMESWKQASLIEELDLNFDNPAIEDMSI